MALNHDAGMQVHIVYGHMDMSKHIDNQWRFARDKDKCVKEVQHNVCVYARVRVCTCVYVLVYVPEYICVCVFVYQVYERTRQGQRQVHAHGKKMKILLTSTPFRGRLC